MGSLCGVRRTEFSPELRTNDERYCSRFQRQIIRLRSIRPGPFRIFLEQPTNPHEDSKPNLVIRKFDSCNPSPTVRLSKSRSPISAEMPANGGLLQSGTRSQDSQFNELQGEFAESLRPLPQIFPFSGDSDLRPGSIAMRGRLTSQSIR
jgi:hypothetical protein